MQLSRKQWLQIKKLIKLQLAMDRRPLNQGVVNRDLNKRISIVAQDTFRSGSGGFPSYAHP
jgi:hypothetical protein